jgi:acyl dehydratase
MPIDPDKAVGAELPSRDVSWDSTDVLRYHLAVGADELSYVYEEALAGVLPSFATVVTTLHDTEPPTVRMPGIDVDLARVVHGRQEITMHHPIPVTGHCTAHSKVVAVYDKGTAAIVVTETTTELFTSRISIFVKGEGGFGGDRGPDTRVPVPDREPDDEVLSRTDPRQALWYRLLGDRNPLHVDPAFAARAGFPRPILHGLCTYGIVLKAAIGTEPDRVASYRARFAGVVFPGDTVRTRVWREDGRLVLQASVGDRPVLSDAVVTLR